MMGLEIAGLAFGVVPILLRIIDDYTEVARNVQAAWKITQKLEGYKIRIQTAEVEFAQSLVMLLDDILPPETMRRYWDNPYDIEFTSDGLEKLKDVLETREYLVIVSKMTERKKALEEIRTKLEILARQHELGRLRVRVKVNAFLSSNKFESCFSQLEGINSTIKGLLDKQASIKETSNRFKNARTSTFYSRIQRRARDLHDLLIQKKNWACNCHHPETAHLQLACRELSTDAGQEDGTEGSARLNVILTYKETFIERPVPESQSLVSRELEITHAELTPVASTLNPRASVVARNQNSPLSKPGIDYWNDSTVYKKTQKLKEDEGSEKKPKALSFIVFTRKRVYNRNAFAINPSDIKEQMLRSPDPHTDRQLGSICEALLATACKGHLGFIEIKGENGNPHVLHHFHESISPILDGVYPIRAGSRVEFASLLDLLALSPDEGLTMDIRMNLCLILASSVLQLYESQWQEEVWSSGDVFFPIFKGKIYIGRPVFRKLLHSFASENNPKKSPGFIKNESLLSLGAILTELALRRTIDSCHAFVEAPRTGYPRLDLFTTVAELCAERGRLRLELGETFADIVSRCVYVNFGIEKSQLSDDELVAAVHRNVVQAVKSQVAHFPKLLAKSTIELRQS